MEKGQAGIMTLVSQARGSWRMMPRQSTTGPPWPRVHPPILATCKASCSMTSSGTDGGGVVWSPFCMQSKRGGLEPVWSPHGAVSADERGAARSAAAADGDAEGDGDVDFGLPNGAEGVGWRPRPPAGCQLP